MAPRYSKLLLHDLILPDTGANAYQTIWEMSLMTVTGGMERSQTQWTEPFEEAGIELVKFWVDDQDADGIVEAVFKG